MLVKSASSVALAALAMLCCSVASATELTTNGGFEASTPPTTFAPGWTQFPTGPNQFISVVNPASGLLCGEIFNQSPASNSLIKQANLGIGTVTPGQQISISFDARGSAANGGVAFAEFFSEISGGGTSKAQILGGSPLSAQGLDPNPNVWHHFAYTTTAGPDVSGGVTLQLGATTGADQASFAHMFYDNASVSVVPEPSTIALLGLGVCGLVALRRRVA
jgi:hypothetical protein